MRWPWQHEPAKNDEAQARIEELNPRHQRVLRAARRVLSSDDIEKLIVDEYAQAEVQRVAGRAKP